MRRVIASYGPYDRVVKKWTGVTLQRSGGRYLKELHEEKAAELLTDAMDGAASDLGGYSPGCDEGGRRQREDNSLQYIRFRREMDDKGGRRSKT